MTLCAAARMFTLVLAMSAAFVAGYTLTEDRSLAYANTDTDADGIPDDVEVNCGSSSSDPGSTPERIDDILAGATEDLDAGIDEALPGTSLGYDCDGDGFTGTAEAHVYSYYPQANGDQKRCGEYDLSHPNPGIHNKPSLRWPSDLNKDPLLGSENRITVSDITTFLAPLRYLDTDVGTNPADVRWDLVPGAGIFEYDINVQDLTAVTAGPTGFPRMFEGEQAYNGPICGAIVPPPGGPTPCEDSPQGCNRNIKLPSLPPHRYWAQQSAYIVPPGVPPSNGIQALVSVEDVGLHDITCADASDDPHCDFVLHGIGVADVDLVQIGFGEGTIPWAGAYFQSVTPLLYKEQDTICDQHTLTLLGYEPTFVDYPRYSEFLGVRWLGETEECQGLQRYVWWFERGINFAPSAKVRMSWYEGNYYAQSEHFNNVWMEPNGLACFGNAGCVPQTPGYSLTLWDQNSGYGYLWDASLGRLIYDTVRDEPIAKQRGNGYRHHSVHLDWAFRTSGEWE